MSNAIQEDFEKFHRENPQVLRTLEDMTRAWFAAGNQSVGIGMLWEALRWNSGIDTEGDAYKLNNNYRSRYVRLMVDRHPEWAQAFRVRELSAA